MSGGRKYASGTEKALFLLSRGFCYAPGCKKRVVLKADDHGDPRVNVQIAHIRALKKGEPRYDETMTDEARNSFYNLILLCKQHHDEVDGRHSWHKYSVNLLDKWKRDREGDLMGELQDLDWITKEKLQSMMAEAIVRTRTDIMSAIDGVATVSQDTAEVLRSLVAETFDRPYLSPDDIASLEFVARVFQILPDYGGMLHESAAGLRELPDQVGLLHSSAMMLQEFMDEVPTLFQAAQILESMSSQMARLPQAAETIERAGLCDIASQFNELDGTVTRLMQASTAARDLTDMEQITQAMEEASENLFQQQRWSYFRWGFAVGVFLVVAILVLAIFVVK